ncbi:1-acyl-sn-glycerol-3-phosphate acyltransferase [Butyrivibrio sp. INlla16]|uniref:1-acyl-sn-glycerol-3-phosphate acyltransferase n=1 Tax=Butyrivibrio sp. INlla16 TaxID=1520807 RepID=UPI00088EA983|nr:1-acyl-sn-glycerol-3-phosphate acyltransferase [Butyrivibrio sp. INlla16]SDB45965.1 Acyltransferase [Butyrivibrio sp. INlla16]
MKIKIKSKSYAEVSALSPYKNKKPCRQTAFWKFLMKTVSKKDLEDCRFSYTSEGMEKLGKDEPCLILMNHSSSTDLEIAATIFADRPFHIVTTLDGFVGKEWLLRRLGCIPARKFITDLPLVKDMMYCFKDLKESVLMYPEASYSFDGTATGLPSSIGKSLKLFKVPVIMVTTTGAFHRDPLYNGLQKRDVKVTAKVKYLLSPSEIESMSAGELGDIIKKEFSFDHWRWQRENGIKIDESFRADGLERVLFRCPVCGKERVLKGSGASLVCSSCHTNWELSESGELNCKTPGVTMPKGNYDFSYVSDWYRWERDCIKKEVTDGRYYLDIPVDIIVVKDTNAAYRVGEGRLIHNKNGFSLTGCGGELDYQQSAKISYSLYADYYWYEIGDMISIGNMNEQYYCFPKDKSINVAKVRLAVEEIYKLNIPQNVKSASAAI